MNNELANPEKKKIYRRWKQGQLTGRNNKTLSKHVEESMGSKAKAHLELKLVGNFKGIWNGFCNYVNDTEKTREYVGLLLNGVGTFT